MKIEEVHSKVIESIDFKLKELTDNLKKAQEEHTKLIEQKEVKVQEILKISGAIEAFMSVVNLSKNLSSAVSEEVSTELEADTVLEGELV